MTATIKPGDTVIRTVRYNAPRANYKLIRAEVKTVKRVTPAGYVYLDRDFHDKYHGEDFPFRQWRARRYGIGQYQIELLPDTPENRALVK